MIVKSKRTFGNLLTKGKEYKVIQEKETDYLIKDDQGDEIGFNKSNFEEFELCSLFDGSGIVDIDFKNIEK
jgi:hypothetical protein